MEAMMGYCFDVLGLERLYLDHYTGNPAAGLYLSLGFKYEGVLRKNCRKNGILYDVHLMSMLREEYEALFGEVVKFSRYTIFYNVASSFNHKEDWLEGKCCRILRI